jgi:hypothetical protein
MVGGSNQQNIANRLGPIQNYRCNQYGHLCTDPATNTVEAPPLQPPADAMMTEGLPTLDMTNCMSNDTGGPDDLTPVSKFINDIKALKTTPDNQILVAAISAPPTPYTVEWIPESQGQNTQPGELWPQIQHSCGQKGGDDVNPEITDPTQLTTDMSFGDPGVRIAQFVNAFKNSVLASICDKDYTDSMNAIAAKISQLITPPCITGLLQQDAQKQPLCSVVEHLVDSSLAKKDIALQNCAETSNTAQCWQLVAPAAGSTCAGVQLMVTDTVNVNPNSQSSDIDCSICLPGAAIAGCPCVAGNMVAGCI